MSRFITVGVCLLGMFSIGSSMVFSLVTQMLKVHNKLNQKEIALVALSKELATNVGAISSYITTIPPNWVMLLTAGIINFVGNGLIWLSLKEKVKALSLPQLCGCLFCATMGLSLMQMIIIKKISKNRLAEKDLWTFFTAFVSLGAAIESQLLNTNSISIFLVNTIFPSITSIGIAFTKDTTYPVTITKMKYASYLMSIMLLVPISQYPLLIGLITLCLVILGIATWLDLVRSPGEGEEVSSEEIEINSESSPRSTLKTNMALILMISMCGFGTASTALDNLGQICDVLGYDLRRTSGFLTISFVWTSLGKLISESVMNWSRIRFNISEYHFLCPIFIICAIGHFCIGFAFHGSVYFATILIGFSNGALSYSIFAILLDLYGSERVFRFYYYVQIASPVGSFVFNYLIVSRSFDKNSSMEFDSLNQNQSAVTRQTCSGNKCFGVSFHILGIICLIGALVSLLFPRKEKLHNEAGVTEDGLD